MNIKKFKKISLRIIVGILLLLLLLSALLSLPFVQTYLGKYATNELNKAYGTDLTIEKLTFTAFGSVKLKSVLVRDHHQDTLFFIKRLNTSILDFTALYDNGHPYLGNVILDGLDCKLTQYKGEKDTNLDRFIDAFDDGTPSSGRFRMKSSSMTVINSRFRYTDENFETPRVLDFKQLNGYLSDFFIKGPNVYTNIEKLSFKDYRGLLVQNLKSSFTYTKKNILLDKLHATTEESEMIGRIELKYKREDFSDFNNKVVFDATFEKAVIASNDLNFFYNEFGKNNKFFVDTHLIGTLNNFTTHNLKLVDKYQSEIIGTVNFKNLFDRNKSFYIKGNFDNLSSSYNQLNAILPRVLGNVLPSTLKKLGKVDLSGNVELTSTYINSQIYLTSQLGVLETNLSMQNINNIDNASYVGFFALDNFNVGAFLEEKDLGFATLQAEVDGKGFTKKFLNTKVKGTIDNLDFNNYNYKNIVVDGTMKMPYFKGNVVSNDPNLKMNFDGLVDLSSTIKNYDFKAQIDFADLYNLNFSKVDTLSIFKGNVSAVANGNTINDLTGILKVKDASYLNNRSNYVFEDFELTSFFNEDLVRTITVNSPDIITGKVVGKFKMEEVKKILENAVGSLYANYAPNDLLPNQYLDFEFNIYNKIIDIFIPQVSISENTKIKGKINADLGKFEFDFNSPNVLAFENYFENIKIDIDNKNPLYNAYVEIDSIKNKNYKIAAFSLINLTLNDTLFVRTEFKGGKKSQDKFDLNLYHTIDADKNSVIGLKKSELSFKDYVWFVNEKEEYDNKIVFDKQFKNISFQDFTLSHNDQKMDFYGTIKDSTYKDLNLNFKNVDLNKITPAVDSLRLDGNLNGNIKYLQNNLAYKPEANLHIDNLKINKFNLGDLFFNIAGNEEFDSFNIDAKIKQEEEESFYLKGKMDYKNNQSNLDMEAGFKAFELNPFGPLLSSILSNVRGNATGRATIGGSLTEPEIDGRLYLNNSGVGVPYLNVNYDFEKNAIVDLTEHQFIFRNIQITDTKYNTKGTLQGNVRHNVFADWEIDLEVKSKKLLALDTNYLEEAYYYGTAFMNGFATVKGPVNSLVINVVGESEKGTNIKIPISDSEDLGNNSFLNFITEKQKYSLNKETLIDKNKYNGLELNLDFDIDTDASVEIILNTESGHSMKGTGYGSMQININTLGKFLMYGDYIIEEGEYNFKYGGLIDKKFKVKKGGTIRWDGEPLGANLNLEAIYNTQANPALLLESASFNREVSTNVSILLNGTISNPEPDFNIDFPSVSSVLKSEIDYRLQNKDARQTQAMALLSTGSFMTAENAGNVAYGPLFERVGSILSDIFSDEESLLKLGVDYNQGDRVNQISDRVGVTLNTMINDKISINGKVGVPVGGVTQSVLVGNLEILMKLNQDGTLQAHVFNKENDINYNIGGNIGYTQGIGLTYSVDFDSLSELMRILFEKKKMEEQESSNQPEDSDLSPDYMNWMQEKKKIPSPEKEKAQEPLKVPELE
uniref:translocation/assembly module TamB domain-containing protein n=1 Tax=Flavobacterium sp. TaxID=239 RepID=UPI004049F4A1